MSERKSSDVLLDIEAKVIEAVGMLRNIDNNLKHLLNQKNITEQTVKALQEAHSNLKQVEKIQLTAEAPAQTLPHLSPKSNPDIPSVSASVEAVDFPQVDNPVPIGGLPRTVQEKIIYEETGKIVLLAQVEIFSEDGRGNLVLVQKTRTNNQGAWTAKLKPGFYKVRVAKQAVQNKPAIAKTYDIRVTAGDGPLTLESRKL